MTRVLALDHGSARCGMAVSDPSGTIATPLEVVLKPDSDSGLDEIVTTCREMGVARIIVGLPLSLDGSEGEQAGLARAFAARLAERTRDVKIGFADERLTTKEARGRGGSAAEDSRAAAVLLERWLADHAGETE